MRVLFIVPPYGYKKEGGKVEQKLGFMPPIAVSLIATIMDHDGHDVNVLDMQVEPLTKEELLAYVGKQNPDVVTLSMLSATEGVVGDMIKSIKDAYPSITTIVGGVHASMFPKETLTLHPTIDYVTYGEAEHTIKELLRALEDGTDMKKVQGVYFRRDGEMVFTGFRPIEQDLDVFPIPSRKFYNLNNYIPTPNQYKRLPATNMITGRGCTYSLCTFCFESTKFVRDKGYRRISVDQAIKEVCYLVEEFGVKEISFWDDEFLMGSDWVEEFCDRLVLENLDVTWSCYGKVNFVNPPLLKKMAAAGCWNIFYGLESGNQKLLNLTKKGQTLQMMRDAVQWAHDAGIEIRGSFILGLPEETPEMAQKTIDFAKELDLDYALFCMNTPHPGTIMHDMCASGEYGELDADKTYAEYTNQSPVFKPKAYESMEQLLTIKKRAYRQFYFRPKYVARKLKTLKSSEDVLRYWRGVNFLVKIRLFGSQEL
jgi:anaerobic magnesium-protoporphyrin IX monomethyl ester cyclase